MLELKSWPVFFQAIADGIKKHDVRDKTEHNFKVDDVICLLEYDPFKAAYTGRSIKVQITYITSNDSPCAFSSGGLDKKLCILSYERASTIYVK